MSSVSSPNHPRLWEQRNPVIAGVLAWLIPGAGHFYQGRAFKGIIYFVCILGLYLGGEQMGEWNVVYHSTPKGQRFPLSAGFAAQLCVGLPSIPAFIQTRRAGNARGSDALTEPLDAPFTGMLESRGPGSEDLRGVLRGRVHLELSEERRFVETLGTFNGTLNGKPIELQLGDVIQFGPAIASGLGRRLEVRVQRNGAAHPDSSQTIIGTVPRRFVDAYAAPPDQRALDEVTRRLGRTFELAQVFTWVAGLLNLLAIWDCVQGPAYGFGDEPPPAAAGTEASAKTMTGKVSPAPNAVAVTIPATPSAAVPRTT